MTGSTNDNAAPSSSPQTEAAGGGGCTPLRSVPGCDAGLTAADRLRVLDLFSGIGGFSLGLERAGMETVAFCEIDPFCRRVLAKLWPETPCYDDVRELTAERLAADRVAAPDVICGGFPCQDLSRLGKRDGLAGERSGLWAEVSRLVGELRPSYIVLENVPELALDGLGRVLGDLASVGYDAEWEGVPAAAVGAPQLRARTWILAYPAGFGDRLATGALQAGWNQPQHCSWWLSEPTVGRVVDGLSAEPHRLGPLGNAVVPQIPEIIGRAIIAADPASRLERAA